MSDKKQDESVLDLYQRGIITSSQGCHLTGLDRYQFEELIWMRHIPLHYTEEDLDQDIKYASGNP